MLEKNFQAKVVKYLRSKGCIVLKYQQNATTRASIPDIFWCYKKAYGFLEVKRDSKASFRPGQKECLERLSEWTYAKVVFPENWGIVKKEIKEILQNEDL